MRLEKNFTIDEVYNWINRLGYNDETKNWLIKMCKDDIESNPDRLLFIKSIATELQRIRDFVNQQFPEFGGKLTVNITSWLRPIEWEKFRRRSGNSRHTNGDAVDFIIGGAGGKTNEIMHWLFRYLNNWNGGLAAFVRNGMYSFIHIDLGRKRRWYY